MRRDDREEKLARTARNLARTLLASDACFPFGRILSLEPLEHGANTVVEHQVSCTLTTPSSMTTGNVSTGKTAGRLSALPVLMSMRAPCRGQIA